MPLATHHGPLWPKSQKCHFPPTWAFGSQCQVGVWGQSLAQGTVSLLGRNCPGAGRSDVYDTLQGGGRGGPIRLADMVPAAQPAARVQGGPPVLYGLGSVGVTPGPALRAASTASTSRPAVNKGCVLYYGQDNLRAAQHSADSHLARGENDLTLQIFGNQKTGCMRGGGAGTWSYVCLLTYQVLEKRNSFMKAVGYKNEMK